MRRRLSFRTEVCVTLIDCLVLVYVLLCIDILMQAAWEGLAEGKKQNAEASGLFRKTLAQLPPSQHQGQLL